MSYLAAFLRVFNKMIGIKLVSMSHFCGHILMEVFWVRMYLVFMSLVVLVSFRIVTFL